MAKPKILIVDDDYINHNILDEILQNDYNILQAFNGMEAIELYNTHEKELSLVLLDMMLPDKTGIQVITHLKSEKPLEVPIIFVTGADDEELESNSIELRRSRLY